MTEERTSCCAPARGEAAAGFGAVAPGAGASDRASASAGASDRNADHRIAQCTIPAGTFLMGDDSRDAHPEDGEGPRHEVTVGAFEIDATPVTNAQFARFVAATGFRTDAERFGVSAVFHLLVEAPTDDILGPTPGTPWWIGVRGADWQHPGGRAGSLDGLDDHPAVHVSWNDAAAYAAWAGRRLPTEAEWERAARGGVAGATFPWGDAPIDGSDRADRDPALGPDTGSRWRANVWQGAFPAHNTVVDGWIGTAPVHSYSPNAFGLWQAVGNVWEWCADWFDPHTYRAGPRVDPVGPARGAERVLRGGSYLCHPSYCNRYRNSARSRNTPDSSMGNAGFRTVS